MKNTKMTTKLNFWALILLIVVSMTLLASCGKDPEVIQGAPGEQGAPGVDGQDGETPYIGENGTWWIGSSDTGVSASATNGKDGIDGVNGKDGAAGKDGVTPKFNFNAETNILSVSYDDGETWVDMIDLNGMCQDGVDGIDGIDGNTPLLKIDEVTNNWMVSYDGGTVWDSLNVSATGAKGEDGRNGIDGLPGTNGTDGKDGKNGVDGKTPLLQINTTTNYWEVSYDKGVTWESLNVRAKGLDGTNGAQGQKGADGEDGTTPKFKVNNDKLYVSYDEEKTWNELFNFKEIGITSGEDGITPKIDINKETNEWQVSYDEGNTWESLGVTALGKDGESAVTPELVVEDNKLYAKYVGKEPEVLYDFSVISGEIEVPKPEFLVNGTMLTVKVGDGDYQNLFDLSTLKGSIDSGEGSTDGAASSGGVTPILMVEDTILKVSYDGGKEYSPLFDFSTIRIDGKDGQNGKDGTNGKDGADGKTPTFKVEGTVLQVSYGEDYEDLVDLSTLITGATPGTDGTTATTGPVDVYTDALDFYPINGGKEYGVRIGRAIYLSKIVIPATYNGKPVTTILEDGFTGKHVEEIVISEGVTTIQDNAFSGCYNLKSISIPASVVDIGTGIFAGIEMTVYMDVTEPDELPDWIECYGDAITVVWKTEETEAK